MAELLPGASPQGYRVLARKYRPKTFADLIGQDALVRTLTNAFSSGRIAQAYMLTGVRGVGKTTTARLIARALNYPAGATVDMPEITPQCEAILESRHMDVIEMDAASNTGVDNMREIIDSVRYAPVSVRTKVYIIDEVHMLSKSAFNALLKTLEEPPPHVKFIFATTEIRKVPVTILSRCQRFDLKRLDASLLTQHYANICKLENVEAEDEALRMIARAAEGSVRDGLSLLDQAIAHGNGKVTAANAISLLGLSDRGAVIDLFEAIMSGDAAKAITLIAAAYENGGEPETTIADLADFTHWVTRLKVAKDLALQDHSRTEDEKQRGSAFSEKLGMAHLTRAWQMLLKGHAETLQAASPIQAAEMVVIRLAHAALLPSGEELLKIAKEARPAAVSANLRPAGNVTAQLDTLRRDATKMEGAGEPRAAAAYPRTSAELAPKPTPQPPPAAEPPRTIASFADIIALVAEKRDIKLKSNLEMLVRPISVSDGKIELALEKDAHPGLPGELGRRLEAWTGRRWIVSVASAGGAAPLARQKQDARDKGRREAMENPTVQAILSKFPGSMVTDVRVMLAPQPQTSTEETDEEPE
jgi:DNA polymerase-3 subunit gamma/tau